MWPAASPGREAEQGLPSSRALGRIRTAVRRPLLGRASKASRQLLVRVVLGHRLLRRPSVSFLTSLPILTRISGPSDSCVPNSSWISRLHFTTTVMMFFSCFRSTFHRARRASPGGDRHAGALALPWDRPARLKSGHRHSSPQLLAPLPRRRRPSRGAPYLQILRCLLQKSTPLRGKKRS